ncbi:MAG TPA: hypothetical protein VNO52_14480, partial [Methylomirabilota bacterium]|nr:hypothetical protein [Methylomirabilota bacterium]
MNTRRPSLPGTPAVVRLVAGLALLAAFVPPATAATYSVGQTVNDFTLYLRKPYTNANGQVWTTNRPVRLREFEGKIVFLEFFAVWCPFCVAAANETDPNILDHYSSLKGTSNGKGWVDRDPPVVKLKVLSARRKDELLRLLRRRRSSGAQILPSSRRA